MSLTDQPGRLEVTGLGSGLEALSATQTKPGRVIILQARELVNMNTPSTTGTAVYVQTAQRTETYSRSASLATHGPRGKLIDDITPME